MKRTVLFVFGLLAISAGTFAQMPADAAIEKALAPAPRQLKEGATVIKFKMDNRYDPREARVRLGVAHHERR